MNQLLYGLAIFGVAVFTVFSLIVIYEVGHYVAGIVVGIPRQMMKIQLVTFPQHVALRDAESWISPLDYQRYVGISLRFLKDRFSIGLYISAGLIFETLFLVTLVLMLPETSIFPFVVASVAMSMTVLYLLTDSFRFFKIGSVSGDFSGLWVLSPVYAIFFTIAVLAIKLALVFYVL